MPACHDMQCNRCGAVYRDLPVSCELSNCRHCEGVLEILWNRRPQNATPLDSKETTVVYRHPVSGKVVYPGRNDVPMPERYRRRGFERYELRSLRQVDAFSRQYRVVNERAHFDRGSGRGFEDHEK